MTYVLGLSGLGESQPFMRRAFPGLDERIYRLAQGADAAAALITEDGVVAAAAEERFVRDKGTGGFPRQAIEYVLAEAGAKLHDVDAVAHNFDYGPYRAVFASSGTLAEYEQVYAPQVISRQLFDAFPREDWADGLQVRSVPHHRAHAASAYYCSGFPEADVLVADGIGEFESTTLYSGRQDGLAVQAQVRGLHSIGLVYGLVTMHLGFWMNMDEYKVMGLAPYGDQRPYADAFEQIVVRLADGGYATPLAYLNRTARERATYERSLEHLEALLGPPREPGSALEQRHLNIAATLQAVAESTVLGFLAGHHTSESPDSLCLAGGVALNCVVNQAVRRSGLYRRQYVQPAAGDDGTALGSALGVLHDLIPRTQPAPAVLRQRLGVPYLGPSFGSKRAAEVLAEASVPGRRLPRQELAEHVAQRLASGGVVAVFQGRMEYGPRALGNRSILADPRTAAMRDRINSLVKQREEFRPLAPAVLYEYAATCFDIEDPDDYLWMIETVDVKLDWRERLEAVTHVNGTARIQVVRPTDNPLLWAVIDAFRRQTGIPVVLNTSFNSRGEPIVCSPSDALATYERMQLDAMVLEDLPVER